MFDNDDEDQMLSPKEQYLAQNTVPAATIVAPQGGDFSETAQERQDRLAREQALSQRLSQAKTAYDSALQDAEDREFRQSIVAAVGNAIPGIVAGATAMNTKASVKPAESPNIKVSDQVGKVDKRYKTDYENILSQYKQLASGALTPKDRANLAARYDQMNLLAQSMQGNLDQRAESQKDRQGEQFDRKVENFGKVSENNAQAYSALTQIDDALAESGIQGIDNLKVDGNSIKDSSGKSVDLPGISVPLLGRVTAHNSNAQTLESTMSKVFNVELKDRSGSAVTSPELDRLKIEFGQGKFNTEAQMVSALQRYKKAAAAALRNAEARYEKPIVEEAKYRGMVTSDSFAPKNSQPETKTVNGSTYQKVNGGWQRVK